MSVELSTEEESVSGGSRPRRIRRSPGTANRRRARRLLNPPPARRIEEDRGRFVALWDRALALLAASFEEAWREPHGEEGGNTNANSSDREPVPVHEKKLTSRKRPEDPPSSPGAPIECFDALYAPETERPPRLLALRDLAVAIVCLRRIQDGRIALERHTAEEKQDGSDGGRIDMERINEILHRRNQRLAGESEEEPDEDTLGG